MPTPFESALLNLKLFELRREAVLREALDWFLQEFNPETFAEFVALAGGDRNASSAHRLCRLIWMILHQAIRYKERGPAVSRSTTERRAAKMIRELRRLGYRIETMACEAAVSV